MRLFPRLVMLLACLPLLLPPGVCACGAAEAAAPTRAKVNAAPSTEPPAPKRCGCHAHARTEAPAPTTEAVAPAPHTPEHPSHHAPGCPAAPGAARSKSTPHAEPVDHLTAVAFVTVLADLSALAEPVRAGAVGARPMPLDADPPSYLKHCALRL